MTEPRGSVFPTSGFSVYRCGSAWCAVPPHFRNIQQDPAGFGDTKAAAVAELNLNESYRTWLRRISARPAELGRFVEIEP